MRRARIYVRPGQLSRAELGRPVRLDTAASRRLLKVLRLRRGDPVVLFDGTGGEFAAEVQTTGRDAVVMVPLAYDDVSRESPLFISLGLGISRAERMDFAIQKSVELGVGRIAPLLTERSVVKLDAERGERRVGHWRQVVVSACEQSGRTRVPQLEDPQSLEGWLPGIAAQPNKLYLDPLGSYSIDPHRASSATEFLVVVGPEGGLSPAERERLDRAGFTGMRLGPRIMRTETAAAAAILVLQLAFGDVGGSGARP